MRDNIPANILSQISERAGISPRIAIRFIARNRETNAPERLCLWTGDDHRNINVGGTSDLFYGAGSIMDVANLKHELGTSIHKVSVTLSHLTPEVAQLIRGYNVKGASCEIYTILLNPVNGQPQSPGLRRFKGWVDKAPITTARIGGVSSCKVDLVSVSRNLSKRVPSKRSNENQKIGFPNDRFLEYIAITGNIQTPWGEKRNGAGSMGSVKNWTIEGFGGGFKRT